MSEWSRKTAAKIRERQSEKSIETQRALQEERLLKQHAARRWDELSNAFAAACRDLNAEPGMTGTLDWQLGKPGTFTIGAKSGRRLTVIADLEGAYEITVGPIPAKTYRIAVIEGSLDVALMEGSRRAHPNEIVPAVLEAFLGL